MGRQKSAFDELFTLYRHILTGLLVVLAVIACGAILRLAGARVDGLPLRAVISAGLAAPPQRPPGESVFTAGAGAGAGIGINYTLFSATRAERSLTSLLAINSP